MAGDGWVVKLLENKGKIVVIRNRGTREPVELLPAEGAANEDLLDAYPRLAQDDIRALLRLIAQETRMHAGYAKKSGLHFGHVGDLGAVRRSLVEVLAQLAQQDEQFVWKRLAEARAGRKA